MIALKKVGDLLNRLLGLMIAVTFSVMIAACVLQVFTRYVLNNSLSWTEELARFTFIWANLLGAALCVRRGSHATVTALLDIFPNGVRKCAVVVIQAIVMLIALVMIRYGAQVTLLTRQSSPALKLNMAFIHVAVPISGTFILVYAGAHLAQAVGALLKKEDVQ